MYELDTNAARKADTGGSNITEIGKYIGVFTQAEDLTTEKNTKGVALNFETIGGQKTRLSIYTTMADGKKLMGFDTLMSLLTCMKLRGIKPVPGTVKYWDNEARAEATRPGKLFPELCGPQIGLLLETEDYAKQDGGVGHRMNLKFVFQAGTELTATEILDRKTQPLQLEKMVAGLRHRPIKATGQRAAIPNSGSRAAAPAGGSGFDDMDDDIPF